MKHLSSCCYIHFISMASFYYQTKQRTIKGAIPENDHALAFFDRPILGDFMIPGKSTLIIVNPPSHPSESMFLKPFHPHPPHPPELLESVKVLS